MKKLFWFLSVFIFVFGFYLVYENNFRAEDAFSRLDISFLSDYNPEYTETGWESFVISPYDDLAVQKTNDGLLSDLKHFFYQDKSPPPAELKILAFGDMMLGRYVATLMDRHGKDYIFEKLLDEDGNFFWDSDIVHANLEGPIKGQGTKGGTSMVFSFSENVAPFLKENGFNVLSIANNHSLDQGWSGRESTISALDDAGVGWCGHPTEADPKSVYYGQIDTEDDTSATYAFVCFQDVSNRLNSENALALIEDVSEKVDYLIVSVHWGYEYKNKPSLHLQVEPGRAFVDAGADLVIGHHPHVVQTFEIYKDRFIFYSLGNFVFDQYWSQGTQEGLAIGVVLKDLGDKRIEKIAYEENHEEGTKKERKNIETTIYLFPMKSHLSQSRLMEDSELKEWTERFLNYGEYSEDLKRMIRSGIVRLP